MLDDYYSINIIFRNQYSYQFPNDLGNHFFSDESTSFSTLSLFSYRITDKLKNIRLDHI